MIRRFSVNFAIFSIFVDLVVITFDLWFTANIRPFLGNWLGNLTFVKEITQAVVVPVALYALFPLVWVLIMAFFAVYDGRKNLRVVDEFSSLTLSALLAGISLAGLLYLSYRDISRLLFATFVFFTYLTLLGWRIPARLWCRQHNLRLGHIRRVLIMGAGMVGREVETQLQNHAPEILIVGFLDDDPQKNQKQAGILGTLDKARVIVQSQQVSDVIVALPLRAHVRMNQLIWALFDLPVRVQIVRDCDF